MTIKVESSIPLPAKFPFGEMKVNDSFAVPAGVKRTAIAVAATRYGKKHGGKFTVRQMPDKTLRCWRIE
jgi:hypothetical protein